jgi:hypothetical protein
MKNALHITLDVLPGALQKVFKSPAHPKQGLPVQWSAQRDNFHCMSTKGSVLVD